MIPRNYSEAQSELAKRRERKEKRAVKRVSMGSKSTRNGPRRRPKSPSRAKLEKEAWDAFSLYIRERDKDKGCISCGGPVEQAGHMISRRRRATKYDERNVNGQCKSDNWADKFVPGAHDKNVIAFAARWGFDVYQDLINKSQATVQHSKADIILIRDTYREKLLTLKSSRAQPAEDDRMWRWNGR